MQIIIAESQVSTLKALVMLLDSMPDREVVGIARNQTDLLTQVCEQPLDLAIVDAELPGGDFLALLSKMRKLDPHMGVIVLRKDTGVKHSVLEAGADAFVLKGTPPKELLLAIEAIYEKQKRNLESR